MSTFTAEIHWNIPLEDNWWRKKWFFFANPVVASRKSKMASKIWTKISFCHILWKPYFKIKIWPHMLQRELKNKHFGKNFIKIGQTVQILRPIEVEKCVVRAIFDIFNDKKYRKLMKIWKKRKKSYFLLFDVDYNDIFTFGEKKAEIALIRKKRSKIDKNRWFYRNLTMIFITLELIDPEKCFWYLDPCFLGQGTSWTHIQSCQTNRVAKFDHQGCQIHVNGF